METPQLDAGVKEGAEDGVKNALQATEVDIQAFVDAFVDAFLNHSEVSAAVFGQSPKISGIVNSIIILSSAVLAITQYFSSQHRWRMDAWLSKLAHQKVEDKVEKARKLSMGITEVDDALKRYDDLNNQSPPKLAPVHIPLFVILVVAGIAQASHAAGLIYCSVILPYVLVVVMFLMTGLAIVVAWAGFALGRAANALRQYDKACAEFINKKLPYINVSIETYEKTSNNDDYC
jgi:hypothetical protein